MELIPLHPANTQHNVCNVSNNTFTYMNEMMNSYHCPMFKQIICMQLQGSTHRKTASESQAHTVMLKSLWDKDENRADFITMHTQCRCRGWRIEQRQTDSTKTARDRDRQTDRQTDRDHCTQPIQQNGLKQTHLSLLRRKECVRDEDSELSFLLKKKSKDKMLFAFLSQDYFCQNLKSEPFSIRRVSFCKPNSTAPGVLQMI